MTRWKLQFLHLLHRSGEPSLCGHPVRTWTRLPNMGCMRPQQCTSLRHLLGSGWPYREVCPSSGGRSEGSSPPTLDSQAHSVPTLVSPSGIMGDKECVVHKKDHEARPGKRPSSSWLARWLPSEAFGRPRRECIRLRFPSPLPGWKVADQQRCTMRWTALRPSYPRPPTPTRLQ